MAEWLACRWSSRWAVVAAGESAVAAGVAPIHLTAEYLTNPQGLGVTRPRLGWRFGFRKRRARQ